MTEAEAKAESFTRRNDERRVSASERDTAADTPSARVSRMFQAEADFVWRLLHRFGVPSADVEDLTHEVFLIAFRRLDSYDTSRPLRPWLFGIAFRVASRFKSLARNSREIASETDMHQEGQTGHEDELDARRVLSAALAQLGLDQRAVFVMHEMEGWSMPEVAGALSIPLNTGYSRLRLAREQVKEAVTRLRAQGGDHG
jgi:RNA polymerase sigma-70 factor (ECF subfamily)